MAKPVVRAGQNRRSAQHPPFRIQETTMFKNLIAFDVAAAFGTAAFAQGAAAPATPATPAKPARR